MEDVRQKAKQLILDSPVSRMVPLEKIESVFNSITVYDSKEEFDEVVARYKKYSYDKVSGFSNKNRIFIGPEENVDKLVHIIVHETLHMFSKKWDENGNVIQHGMTGHKDQYFKSMVNEGVTDYLTKRIVGGNYCQYSKEASIIEEIDKHMQIYFEDTDVLFSMYLEDDNTGLENKRFKEFLDNTGGKGSYDELYENINFMGPEKRQEYLKRISKGTKRFVRKRNIKKTINKVRGIFIKQDKNRLLNEFQEEGVYEKNQNIPNIVNVLQGEVKEVYEEIPPKEKTAKEEKQL